MDIEQIKKLRSKTGASVSDCTVSLKEASGDFNLAIEMLRKRGVEIAKMKASREAKEGRIGSYVHTNAKVAAFIALYCETDFVARNEEFAELSKDIAMQVVAMSPLYRAPDDVPKEVIEKEEEIERENLQREGKQESIINQILVGKIDKFYEKVCLLKQPFIKDNSLTVEDLIGEKIQKLGENIEVGNFMRLEL